MDTYQVERRHGGVVAAIVMAVGGGIGVVGSLLTWASVSATQAGGSAGSSPGGLRNRGGAGGRSARVPRQRPLGGASRSLSLHGLDTSAGRLVLALFIALVVVAVAAWVGSRFWFRLGAVSAGLVLGVIALVLTATDLSSPASLFGVVQARIAQRGIPVSAGLGLYVALGGAILAVAAAVFWLAATRRWWTGSEPAPVNRAPVPPAPAPGPAEAPTTQLPRVTDPGLAES